MWLVVGLGNPGAEYAKNRHNVGFMVVDDLARSEGIELRKMEKGACVGRGVVSGRQALLVKPQGFMNKSGEAVAALAQFYKVPLGRCLVIADDLEQPPADLKLAASGGHGGHNGLRSITERLGNDSGYPRLKIGIGRPPGQLDVASYVLQDFSKKEAELVEVAVAESTDIVRRVLAGGVAAALNK
ncbi:hypothetical protein FOA52_001203 [Chlamydomonas sp. UWO 241]|nr:hypothetical protein FOA52_001203 [Chlamydomonas sp. UWO 241]